MPWTDCSRRWSSRWRRTTTSRSACIAIGTRGDGFADLMIARAGEATRAGAGTLYTFDRKAARREGVTLLPAGLGG